MPRHPARRAGQAHEQALNKPCYFKLLHSFLSVLTLKSEKMLEQCQCFFPSFRLCNLFLLTGILTILLIVTVIVNSSQICSISHFFNECPLFSVCLAVKFYPQPFHCMVLKKRTEKQIIDDDSRYLITDEHPNCYPKTSTKVMYCINFYCV